MGSNRFAVELASILLFMLHNGFCHVEKKIRTSSRLGSVFVRALFAKPVMYFIHFGRGCVYMYGKDLASRLLLLWEFLSSFLSLGNP